MRSSALKHLGETVRGLRRAQGLTRADLAGRSGLSLRFLAQLEGGAGNISYLRLRQLAAALGLETGALIERAESSAGRSIALIGMRGAGKSVVGVQLAERLRLPFVELDEAVESDAGMSLRQLFELQGESSYRRIEHDSLARVLSNGHRSVFATGGGIVTARETYCLLRRRALTVWLKATPREHWDRVSAQGDLRPISRPDAVADMHRLWAERSPLYAEADLVVETTGRSVPEVVEAIMAELSEPETVTDPRNPIPDQRKP
jgi:XRE family aerobic/anaerobic benzoate catabolism transcriptional regulator